jgi:hypothetical protein
MEFLILQLPQSTVSSSLLGQNTALRILFSDKLNLRSFVNVGDQISQAYKITG